MHNAYLIPLQLFESKQWQSRNWIGDVDEAEKKQRKERKDAIEDDRIRTEIDNENNMRIFSVQIFRRLFLQLAQISLE